MVELTLAHVAGLIAAGFFIANQLSPNGLAFVISRCMGDKNSAATLTVASSALHKSLWPLLLRTDVCYIRGVRSSILWLARLITLMSILLAVAAIVTPLGLYSVLLPGDERQATFVYSPDLSSFGYGTPPRSELTWARQCGGGSFIDGPRPCPFSDTVSVVTYFPNGTISYNYTNGYNLNVPDFLLQTYSSGTNASSTVSNYFDIQYRRYATRQDDFYNNNTVYLVSANRNIESLVQDNRKMAVEGLIVDAEIGRIGFRNHTVPDGFVHGSRWDEDVSFTMITQLSISLKGNAQLLFVEPETFCLDTNLTLDYNITNSWRKTIDGLYLTDRGGFSPLSHIYPEYGSYNDTSGNANLYARAYKAAWLHNAYIAIYLNVTNAPNGTQKAWSYMTSEIGKQYRFGSPGSDDSGVGDVDALVVTPDFGNYVKPALDVSNSSGEDVNSVNPWGIGPSNWSTINLLCSGAGNGDYANISNILVACGQMRGVPQRIDGGSPLIYEAGSQWSQKIFACATSVKASVKTVSLSYNSTGPSIESLTVDDIRDKQYSDNASMPLWGVENTGNAYNNSEIDLIWGIVDDIHVNNPNVSTARQPHLFLPGWLDNNIDLGLSYGNWQNLPGSDFIKIALRSAYSVDSSSLSSVLSGLSQTSGVVDYSGQSSLAMWARWQNLTAQADLASLIPNLIFTDVAASTVVGTKGVLGPGNIGTSSASISVRPIVSTVRYHLPYAIPAFVAAVMLLLIVLGAIASAIFPCDGLGGIHRLRHHIQGLQPGRIYSMLMELGHVDPKTSGKDWNRQFGESMISIDGHESVAENRYGTSSSLPNKEPHESTRLRHGSEDDISST
ncbi:hypothetical protein HII31_12560 [Pseudocercospora fuligena]|uniref:Uncharacterized protein n=1 Tax=Pseudocercospora fuligena TaxID=685502 RepID=A0A8H6R6N9_9PEZI|nr:hypothetical protein HII31_12560 [Pseudocercospora fuligena]